MISGNRISKHAFLDHGIPKIEVFVLTVQLIVGNHCQMLADLASKKLPIPVDLSGRHEGPEYLLNGYNTLVAAVHLLQGNTRFDLHAIALQLTRIQRWRAKSNVLGMNLVPILNCLLQTSKIVFFVSKETFDAISKHLILLV